MRRPAVLVAASIAGASALAGCAGSPSGGAAGAAAAPTSPSRLSGTITVLAAASLTEAFGALGRQFETAHPGTRVRFSFGASSSLATQITQGAPADVFASASGTSMDQVVAARAADNPTTFARNRMEIAVPPGNPARIATVADLARPGVKVVLCAAVVPCGSTAREVLANAKVTVRPVSLEADVKSTLAKVQLGEADAGVVYVTDVQAAGTRVTGVQIPAGVNAFTAYPIDTLAASGNPALAAAFKGYVLSADGQGVLAADGFAAP